MVESRIDNESNDTMIRITALKLTRQNLDIEFATRLARHRSGRPRVGILGKLLGCLPHTIPIFRSSYRKNRRKLISDPRLRHILDRLIISAIRVSNTEDGQDALLMFVIFVILYVLAPMSLMRLSVGCDIGMLLFAES